MLSRLKFAARSTLIYSIGTISIKLIGLILLPIYTDKLSTEQFGMWSLLEVSSQVLVIVIGLRLSTAMIRFYSAAKSEGDKGRIIFTAYLFTTISLLFFNLAAHPFTKQFSILFFESDAFGSYFNYLFIWTSFEILNRLVLDLIRIKEKPMFFVFISVIKFTLVLSLNIYLILGRGMGIDGIILGQLAGSVAVFLASLPFVLKELNIKFSPGLSREMIRYGFPLIFSGVSTFALTMGDRYLLKIFLDYHEVGIYSLAYKISNLLKMVLIQAFQLGFLPIAFNMYDKPDSERFFSKVFTYYVFILAWSGLALALYSREIIILFSSDPSYYASYQYIPWLVISVCFFGMQNFFIIGLHYAKETRRIAIITLVVLAFSMLANLLLIPRFGMYGAAIVAILSGILMTVLNYFQSQKYLPIRYELKKVAILLTSALVLFLPTLMFSDLSVYLNILLKSLILLLFPFLLYLWGFYEQVEIDRIKGFWKKWRNPKYWYSNLSEISRKQSMDSSDV